MAATRVFVDTLFVVALINQRDQYHQQALRLAARRFQRLYAHLEGSKGRPLPIPRAGSQRRAENCESCQRPECPKAYPLTQGRAGGKLPAGKTTSRTPIYTHVLNRGGRGVLSPIDDL